MLTDPRFVETQAISRLNELDVMVEGPGRIQVGGVNGRYEDSQSELSIADHSDGSILDQGVNVAWTPYETVLNADVVVRERTGEGPSHLETGSSANSKARREHHR
jgi:hypothetical protein